MGVKENKMITENSLYAECVKRGIPMNNHESDLYVPATAETRELVQHFKMSADTFQNQVEGGLWFDVAFAFLPWWEQRVGGLQ